MIRKLIASFLMVAIILATGVPVFAEDSVTARPTSSAVLVNGRGVTLDAYLIDGHHYFKLRDLAYVLFGTRRQFDVGWDGVNNTVLLKRGQPYTVVGGEMTGKGVMDKIARPTSSKIILDSDEVAITAFTIEGNNYCKLRDVGALLDFGVDWDSVTNTILIDTVNPYIRIDLQDQDITNERLAAMVANGEIPLDVTFLDLARNPISDLSPLSALTNLRVLSLWGNNNISDITALSSLTNLTRLGLFDASISDLSPLGNLTKLTELSMGGYDSNISDITALSKLTNLTRLGLYETHVSDLHPIENLTELTSLALGRSRVSDLSCLSKLTNLTHLRLDYLLIKDYSPLYGLPKLTSLSLQASNIGVNLSVLRQLPQLTVLDLAQCNIRDVTALGDLTNLTSLRLSDNNITDVSPLHSLTNLTSLNLSRNPITQQDIDELAATLPNANIWSGD